MNKTKIILIGGFLFKITIEPQGMGWKTTEVLKKRRATKAEIRLFNFGLGRLVNFDREIS